ncbi:MAG: hypothetical protein U0169_10215 [Polyangiaceae bacterium]
MTSTERPPFERVEHFTHGALIGARWWQERIRVGSDPIARRKALLTLAALGIGVAGVGAVVAAVVSSSSSNGEARDSLDVQKTYGWNFGGENDPLGTESGSLASIDPSVLDTLPARLAPRDPRWKPDYVGTLFQSVAAVPTSPGTSVAHPLREYARSVVTTEMSDALAKGRSLAGLLENQTERAVIVDLPGPEAVAFALGLAGRLDPVFAFDNWPHPKGVVPAHLTLFAAAHYVPTFEELAKGRTVPSLPAFVLDRNRLAPYADDSDKFDNRYTARIPDPTRLAASGVKAVLYVMPKATDVESDDLNEDLVAYREAGIVVQAVSLDDFLVDTFAVPDGSDGGVRRRASGTSASYDVDEEVHPHHAYYGGSPLTHYWFWTHYGWSRPSSIASRVVPVPTIANRVPYAPVRRSTLFSGSFASKAKPSGFGSSMVVGSSSSGSGSSRPSWSSSRSGSWGRSSGFSTSS